MLKRLRTRLGILAAIAVALIVALAVLNSSSFQKCVTDPGHTKSKQYEEESSTYFTLSHELVIIQCSGRFISDNDAAITAAFTVILGVATLLLWGATRDLVNSAERTAERQVRSYLTVLVGGASYQEQNGPSGRKIRFEGRPILLNTGQTPAREVSYRAVAKILPVPIPKDFVFYIEGNYVGSGVLGAQQSFILNASVADFVPDEEVALIKAKTGMALYVWGVAVYKDVFDVSRRTEFCLSYGWLPDGTIIGQYEDRHNKAT